MFTKEDFKTEFNKSIEFLKDKLAKIHSGRANSSIVEDIKVNYQNFDMPLKQLASISLQGAKTLIIEPWDKGAIQAVERSLLQANLHATPNTEGQKIWLIFPSLTKELKIDIEKQIHKYKEEARISLRNNREEFWNTIQDLEREKEISEDEKFRLKDLLQEVVDECNKNIDEISEQKIKNLE
ncbi:MAG: Ribosome-recycling factor [Parcubacteria group bacterium GW2011_GWA2_31_28]|nr:MAG: Ribosome-recycling factor [Parcubacteria group bacterium GW2011_GWA2_31_28]